MFEALQADILLKSVGSSISTNQGEHLGSIVGITQNAAKKNIEYVIIKSKYCFGRGERYFAIPASSSMITITKTGKVILKASKDELQFAEGILASDCPSPNFRDKPSIYELYKYENPSDEKKETLKH